jgi:hypothetical protein
VPSGASGLNALKPAQYFERARTESAQPLDVNRHLNAVTEAPWQGYVRVGSLYLGEVRVDRWQVVERRSDRALNLGGTEAFVLGRRLE